MSTEAVSPEPQKTEEPIPELRPEAFSRRKMLFGLSVVANAVVGAVFAVPVLGYLLGPAMKKKKE